MPAGDESAAVGVGAALDCVGVLAASPSIWVPIEPPPGEDAVPPDDADGGADCAVGDNRPDTGEPPPECEGPGVLGVPDEPSESARPGEVPPGAGSSKSDRDGPAEGTGLEYGLSEDDGPPELDPGSESELGPAPTSGAPMPLSPVSADIPPPMPAPGPLPLRVEVEESEPEELEPEDEESVDEGPEDEESEEELELSAPETLPLSLPPPPPLSLSLPDNPDGPSYPSTRPSIASRVRLPALCPRLSRTPSAKVCGLCLRASRPASPPAFMVAPTS